MPATSQNDSNIYQVVEAITCLHIRASKLLVICNTGIDDKCGGAGRILTNF